MSDRFHWLGIDTNVVVSGLVAGAGFLVAMAADLAVVKNQADDLILLGGMAPVEPKYWRPLGVFLHFGNSVALALAFNRLWRPRVLVNHRYLSGLAFIQVENALLYPLVLLIGRFHPARRAGKLANFWNPVVFLQEVSRHAVYGLLLGIVLDRD